MDRRARERSQLLYDVIDGELKGFMSIKLHRKFVVV